MKVFAVLLVLGLTAVVGASQLARQPVHPPPSQHPLDASEYVIRGEDASLGTWKWNFALQQYGGVHLCGTTLIHKNWVITAAHCVEDKPVSSLFAVGGMVDRDNPGPYEVRYEVSRVIIHESFDWPKHDIALLQLASGVDTTNPYVQIIDFAPNDGYQYVGDECWVAGWGATYWPGKPIKHMKEARMDVLSDQDCTRLFGLDFVEDNLDICTMDQNHGEDSQICFGDSGSPLSCKRDGKWIAVGSSSWAALHCDEYKPSGYTRFSEYNDWINSYIQ